MGLTGAGRSELKPATEVAVLVHGGNVAGGLRSSLTAALTSAPLSFRLPAPQGPVAPRARMAAPAASRRTTGRAAWWWTGWWCRWVGCDMRLGQRRGGIEWDTGEQVGLVALVMLGHRAWTAQGVGFI